jgi:hypothetical protein
MDSPWETDFAASPVGGYVALKSSKDGLTLIHLPEMSSTHIADLLLPNRDYTEEEHQALYAWLEDSWAATLWMPSLAWSHDGTMLAFVSAMNGVSPDIYLYTLREESILRLTSGSTFEILPSWTPNDKYILHDAANQIWSGKSGRGYSVAGVWIAPPDGASPRLVYTSRFATDKGFENRYGWLSDSVYVGSSEPEWCGPTDLRTIPIDGRSPSIIWHGSFYDAALDPATSALLILIPSETYPWTSVDCAPSENSGLYLHSLATKKVVVLGEFGPSPNYYPVVKWSPEAGLFFVATDEGLLSATPAGEISFVSPAGLGLPTVSPDGQFWAVPLASWEGLWLRGPDGGSHPIFHGRTGPAVWSPADGSLFFLGQPGESLDSSNLYIARPPDFAPALLIQNVNLPPRPDIAPFAWINP